MPPWKILSDRERHGGPFGEGDPGDILEVFDEGDPPPVGEQIHKGQLLAEANLESEQPVWFECVAGLRNEAAVDIETGFACEERSGGLVVADLGVKGGSVGLGDVGRVADDGVEGFSFFVDGG